MRINKVIFLLALTMLQFTFISAARAQNKVVVVPLGGGDVNKKDLVPLRVWRGAVNSDGTKISQGRFTSVRSATGTYRVSLDLNIAGLDTDQANITGFGLPVVSIYFGDPGDSILITSQSKGSSGSQVISLTFDVSTFDSANTASDVPFIFYFMLDEQDGPAESSAVQKTSIEISNPSVKCAMEGDIETCVIGSPEK